MKIKIDKETLKEIEKQLNLKTPLEFIKAGGYKVVYCIKEDKNCEALKIVLIPAELNGSKEELIKRLKREIDILNECKSIYLVKLGKYKGASLTIKENEFFYYSEEFLNGNSLDELIKKKYKPSFSELKSLFLSVLDVIQHLWEKDQKIIHRDIKPQNLIKTDQEKRPFILLDLGLAFIVGEKGLTRESQLIPGTLHYLAPEMFLPHFRQNLDFRADLYALALTVYEYAVSKNPFMHSEDAIYTTMSRIVKQAPEPLKSLRNDLPESFCVLIDQLLKKKPSLRPSNLKLIKKNVEEI